MRPAYQPTAQTTAANQSQFEAEFQEIKSKIGLQAFTKNLLGGRHLEGAERKPMNRFLSKEANAMDAAFEYSVDPKMAQDPDVIRDNKAFGEAYAKRLEHPTGTKERLLTAAGVTAAGAGAGALLARKLAPGAPIARESAGLGGIAAFAGVAPEADKVVNRFLENKSPGRQEAIDNSNKAYDKLMDSMDRYYEREHGPYY